MEDKKKAESVVSLDHVEKYRTRQVDWMITLVPLGLVAFLSALFLSGRYPGALLSDYRTGDLPGFPVDCLFQIRKHRSGRTAGKTEVFLLFLGSHDVYVRSCR